MIYIAARNNSHEAVDLLLDHKADVNSAGGSCHTPLIAACVSGDESMVNKLIDNGASVTIYGGKYDNALVAACKNGRPFSLETYTRLVDGGVDVNRKGRIHSIGTPLSFAACLLSSEVVEFLIDRGAEVNVRDCGSYDNPLQGASSNWDTEFVRVLLKHGADTTFQGAGKLDNCLMAAATNRHVEIVKMLLDASVSPNIAGGPDLYPLIAACNPMDEDGDKSVHILKGKLAVVELLLDTGADVNAYFDIGNGGLVRPLLMTLYRTDSIAIEVIRLLVSHGAEINALEAAYFPPPLNLAVYKGNVEIIKYLDSKFANQPAQPGGYGHPLGLAISSEAELPIIEALIKTVKIDEISDHNRGSALHVAAGTSNFAIVDLLLEAGANPNITHWNGGSVLHASTFSSSSIETIDKLYSRVTDKHATTAEGQNVLLDAVKFGSTNAVKKLLDLGYKIDFVNKLGRSVLHYAAIPYGDPYKIGDTIGAGIDRFVLEYNDELLALFFAKNGKHLGAFIICMQNSLFPVISGMGIGLAFDVNFGEREFFWKGGAYKLPEPEGIDNNGTEEEDEKQSSCNSD